MNITEFTAFAAEELEALLREEMREDVEVETQEVMKMNDQRLHGIMIRGGEDPTPTYYVEEMYRDFQRGADPALLIRQLAEAFRSMQEAGPFPAEMVPDMEYRTIKRKVGLRLAGMDYNREFLKTVPYKDVGNGYALLCDVQIKASDGGIFSTLITNDLAQERHYDMEVLFQNALDNAWKSKSAVLRGAGELMGADDSEEEMCFVLTTDRPRYGAAALFYPGTQAMIAHVLQEDYIALPSSLHEFMIIRASCGASMEYLQQLVREANRTIVQPEEVLSDNILKYCRSTGELVLFTDDAAQSEQSAQLEQSAQSEQLSAQMARPSAWQS